MKELVLTLLILVIVFVSFVIIAFIICKIMFFGLIRIIGNLKRSIQIILNLRINTMNYYKNL